MTDTVAHSVDTFEAILGISEGPIQGLVNGKKSFLIGDTPLVDVAGHKNFRYFNLKTRKGTANDNPVKSALGGIGSSTSVGVTLARNSPVIRTGGIMNIRYIDVRLMISSNYTSNDSGKRSARNMQIRVEYKPTSSATWQNIPGTTYGSLSTETTSSIEDEFEYAVDTIDELSPNSYDRTIYRAATAPGTPDEYDLNPLWINTASGDRPYIWNGTGWVAAGSAVYTSGTSVSTWTWVENGVPQKLYLPGTNGTNNAPSTPTIGEYWAHSSTEPSIYNGVVWATAGTSAVETARKVTVKGGIVDCTALVQSPYVIQLRIPVTPINGTYDIRVTKLSTDNPTTSADYNSAIFSWESFEEIIARSFAWPDLATAQIVMRASDQLQSVPDISGIYGGRLIRVPSNYNPVTGNYAGVWDGTYQVAFSNNPAFIAQDLIENARYGLNAYYPCTIDKFDFYEAGKWCDQIVTGGRRRFTFNGIIAEQITAREAIEYIVGSFGGRLIDNGDGMLGLKLDKDDVAVTLFTPENVTDGVFIYSTTDIATRYNDITVTFVNPNMNWANDTRQVTSAAHITKYGRNPTSFIAFGCTNAAEAIARAKYRLISGISETLMVQFKTNRHAHVLSPYNIILIADPDMGANSTGRIQSTTTSTATLVEPIYVEAGFTYYLNITDDTNQVFRRRISVASTGYLTTVTFSDATPSGWSTLPEYPVYALERVNGPLPKAFRVLTISESANNPEEIDVTAIEVNRTKWGSIDTNAPSGEELSLTYSEDDPDFTDMARKAVPSAPSNITVNPLVVTENGILTNALAITWSQSDTDLVDRYKVYMSVDGADDVLLTETRSTDTIHIGTTPALYRYTILAIGKDGTEGRSAYTNFDTVGVLGKISSITNLKLVGELSSTIFESINPTFSWDAVTDLQFKDYVVQIKNTSTGAVVRTDYVTTPQYSYDFTNNITDFGAVTRSFTVSVAARNDMLVVGTPITLAVSNPSPAAPASIDVSVTSPKVTVSIPKSLEKDSVFVRIHAGATSNFTPSAGNLIYDGPNSNASKALAVGTYYIKAYYVDAFARAGELNGQTPLYNYAAVTSSAIIIMADGVYDTTPPAVPTGLAVTSVSIIDTSGNVVTKLSATWNAASETDFKNYDVDIKEAAGNYVTTMVVSNLFEQIVKPGVQYTVRVRARDTSDNLSAYCAAAAHTAAVDTTAPALASALTATSMIGSILLSWTNPTDTDFDVVEIYEAATNNFASATKIGQVSGTSFLRSGLGNGITKYYWLKTVDYSGNKSGTFPAGATSGVSGVTNTLATNSNNLVLDPQFNDINYWVFSRYYTSIDPVFIGPTALNTTQCVKSEDGNGTTVQSSGSFGNNNVADRINVVGGAQYKISYDVFKTAGFTGYTYVSIYWYKGDKTTAANVSVVSAVNGDHRTTPLAADSLVNGSLVVTAPSDAAWARMTVATVWSSTQANAGCSYFGSPSLTRVITSDLLSDYSITPTKIVLADNSNLNPDPNWLDPMFWVTTTSYSICQDSVATAVSALNSKNVLKSPTGNGTTSQSTQLFTFNPSTNTRIAVVPSGSYVLGVNTMVLSGFTGKLYAEIVWLKGDKTTVASPSTSSATGTDYRTIAASADTLEYISINATAPADAKWCYLRVYCIWSSTQSNTSNCYFGNLVLNRRASAELIVDGAITAVKLAVDSVTAAKIQVGSVTGDRLAANTLTADKVSIGMRGIQLEGLEFEHNNPTTNKVAWTAGTIRYVDDAGALQSAAITANNATWTTGVLYVYWVKAATTLSSTTTATTAFANNNVVLAVYKGGTDLISDYGRTIIDGSKIKTTSLSAIKADLGSITAGTMSSPNGMLIDLNNDLIRSGTYTEDANGVPTAGYRLKANGEIKANALVVSDAVAYGASFTKRPVTSAAPVFVNGVSTDEGLSGTDDGTYLMPSAVATFSSPQTSIKLQKIRFTRTPYTLWVDAQVSDVANNCNYTASAPGQILPGKVLPDEMFVFNTSVANSQVILKSDGSIVNRTGSSYPYTDVALQYPFKWIYDVEKDPTNTAGLTKVIGGLGASRRVFPLIVPTCSKIKVKLWGAGGGSSGTGNSTYGGPGGYVYAEFNVGSAYSIRSGDLIWVVVGQGGTDLSTTPYSLGWGGSGYMAGGITGGGLTGLFLYDVTRNNALAIAGGGGASPSASQNGSPGGHTTWAGGQTGSGFTLMTGVPLIAQATMKAPGGGGYVGGANLPTAVSSAYAGRGGTNYISGIAINTTNSYSAADAAGAATSRTPPNNTDTDYLAYKYTWASRNFVGEGRQPSSSVAREPAGNGLVVLEYVP